MATPRQRRGWFQACCQCIWFAWWASCDPPTTPRSILRPLWGCELHLGATVDVTVGGVDRDTHSPQSHYFYYFSARVVWLSSWVNYQLSELPVEWITKRSTSSVQESSDWAVECYCWAPVQLCVSLIISDSMDTCGCRWDGEMVRWWDGEMVRWWDGEMVRWWDGEMARWWDGEMVRWWDGELKFPLLVKFMCTERDVTRVMRVVLSVALGGPFTYRGVALVNLPTPPSSFEVSGGSTCVVRHLVINLC